MASAFKQFVSNPKRMHIFQQELLAAEVTELMCRTMNETGVSRSALAKQLNKSKGRVSQILASESNLTVHTIADVFTALGKKLTVNVGSISLDEAMPPVRTMDLASKSVAPLAYLDEVIAETSRAALSMGA